MTAPIAEPTLAGRLQRVVARGRARMEAWLPGGRPASPAGDEPAPPPARPHRRVRTPTVLQMEAVECGAASLAMILAHFGRHVPLEELRLACGVSRDGSKANNVLKAAREYGLVAKGFKREPADLATMPVPMILHWNFNHFIVFEGFRKGRAYLNDPNSGPASTTLEEFDQAFTGVCLTFSPGPAFARGGESPSLLAPLRRRLAGSGGAVVFVVLAGLSLLLPGLVAPTFNRIYLDDLLVKGLHEWLRPLLWVMGLTATVTFGLVLLQQRYLLRFESKLSLDTSGKFLWHVLRLPVEFFTQRYAGEIGNRVGINDKIARLLSGDLATTTLNVLVIAGYAALLVQYDGLLTALCVGTAVLNILALRYVSRRRTDLNQRILQDRGKLMGTAMGGLQTIETLKATGSESDFFARWSGYQAKVSNAFQDLQLTTLFLSNVPPLLLGVTTALVLGVGGARVMDGYLTMGMLIAFQSLMFAFLAPVNKLVELGSTLQEVRGDMNRLDDVLRYRTDPGLEALAPVPAEGHVKLEGYLELRGVTFGYNRLDPPLIQDFNLRLTPGMRVALVGGSGCGKTTVAKLVAGLYQPWSGEILFDGKPRTEVPRPVLVNSFAVVDQEVSMFEESIKDNLTLWNHTVQEHDLVQAARDAAIHADLADRPGGYASMVEEGGRNFSGGQRQRMEIARALVLNPAIMVLDEATSALDATTEKEIDESLRRRGCTCLIVAHRLSTIRDCDEILVLDKGRIAQRGTHDELMAVAGHYRDLIAAE
ncbi:MAG: NHLP family bacteriocin export ABC transporter peptidase/permease/ATPase subunit [Gemmatimonadales bacterium]